MANTLSRDTRSLPAGEDLSAKQFYFVKLMSDGTVDLADTAGENCHGIVTNKPTAGREATVVVSGKTQVVAGATMATIGTKVQTDANGKAIAAATGDVVMGYTLEAAVDTQVIAIELIQGGNVVA